MLSDGEISLIENILKSKNPQTMEEYLTNPDGTENTQHTEALLSYLREETSAERIRRIECVLSSRQTAAIEFLLRQDDDNGNFLDTYINSSKDDATKIERIRRITCATNRRMKTVHYLLDTIESSTRDSDLLSLLMWYFSRISAEELKNAARSLVSLGQSHMIQEILEQPRPQSPTEQVRMLTDIFNEETELYFNAQGMPGYLRYISLSDGSCVAYSFSSMGEVAFSAHPAEEEPPPAKRRRVTQLLYPDEIISSAHHNAGSGAESAQARKIAAAYASHSSTSQQPQDYPTRPTSRINGCFFEPGAGQREGLRSTSESQQDPEETIRNEETPKP